jgi:hypothetical protein
MMPDDVCPICRAPLMTLRSVLGKTFNVCFQCFAMGKVTWPAPPPEPPSEPSDARH